VPTKPIVTSAKATINDGGTWTGNGWPPQCAPCISFRTVTAGSRARGRSYLPPMQVAALTAAGRMTDAARDDLAAALDDFFAAMTANAAPPVVEIEETPTQPIVIPVEPVIEQETAAADVPIATSEVLTAETSPLVAAAQRDPIPEPEPIPVHKGPPARVEPLPSKSEPPKPPAPPQKKGGDFSQNFSKRKKKDDK